MGERHSERVPVVIDQTGADVELRIHPGDDLVAHLKWDIDGATPSASVTIEAKVATDAGEVLATMTTTWVTLDALPALELRLNDTQTTQLWTTMAPRSQFRLRWWVKATRGADSLTEIRGPLVLVPR